MYRLAIPGAKDQYFRAYRAAMLTVAALCAERYHITFIHTIEAAI